MDNDDNSFIDNPFTGGPTRELSVEEALRLLEHLGCITKQALEKALLDHGRQKVLLDLERQGLIRFTGEFRNGQPLYVIL
jgi:hypothetical protein